LVQQADIIHLHWVSEGFLNYPSFFSTVRKKIVWTLHDMNPFTGGCHHSDDCMKFMSECRHCPQLQGTIDENFAFEMQSLKKELFDEQPPGQIKIVTPSEWLRRLSSQSALFKKFDHDRIPNGIDPEVFRIHDQSESRKQLNLPADKKILLFVSNEVNNKRKGIDILIESLSKLNDSDVAVCTIGKSPSSFDIKMEQHHLGFITDENKMAMAYNAADVFVLPSLAENFPNTSCESLFCGTPVVAFDVGGLNEQVHAGNGILVEKMSSDALGASIRKVLSASFDREAISREAKSKFGLEEASRKYIKLYESLK